MKVFWMILLGSAGLASTLAAQEAGWSETRFHRVHLRNGYFVDGQLVQDTPTMVVLKMSSGEFGVRKDQIARDEDGKYRVEFIRMRTYNEPAKKVDIKPMENVPAETSTAVDRGTPRTAPPRPEASTWKELPPPTGTKQEQMAQLVERLKGAPPEKRNSMIDSIMNFGKEGAVQLASSFPDMDEGSLATASAALIQAKEADTLPVLRKMLSDKNPSARSAAADVVSSIGDNSDVLRLRPLLKDPDPVVRSSAVSGLAKIKDQDSFLQIAQRLSDTDALVRKKSFEALSGLSAQFDGLKEDFSRVVTDLLDSAKGQPLIDLVKQVAASREKALGKAVAKQLSNDDAMVRANVIAALTDLEYRDGTEDFLRLLISEREYWPRIQLAHAADRLKLGGAIDTLIQWLGDQDNNIQMAASRALRGITGQNLGLNAQAWTDWWANAKPKQ